MKLNIIEESDVTVASSGRIVEIEDGHIVTDSCFICDNSPNPDLTIESSEMGFCCDVHRDLLRPDEDEPPFPVVVKFRPEVGR